MGDFKLTIIIYLEFSLSFYTKNLKGLNMSKFNNVMDVYKLLDKSNCRTCGEKTCMAFAAAVFMGKQELSQCPLLSSEIVDTYETQDRRSHVLEEDFNKLMEKLESRLKKINLSTRAGEIGATYNNDKLSLKIMGKEFSIDSDCKAYSDIHVNNWTYGCVLNYILHCKGLPLTESWVPLRELPGGRDWYRLFGQQCEKVLKKTADTYPDLFSDLVHTFGGKQIGNQFQSDISVVLNPLPLVPMLICYWRPEDGMESSLNLFFDSSAESNLGMDALYQLGTGIAMMLEKLARQHGPKC